MTRPFLSFVMPPPLLAKFKMSEIPAPQVLDPEPLVALCTCMRKLTYMGSEPEKFCLAVPSTPDENSAASPIPKPANPTLPSPVLLYTIPLSPPPHCSVHPELLIDVPAVPAKSSSNLNWAVADSDKQKQRMNGTMTLLVTRVIDGPNLADECIPSD